MHSRSVVFVAAILATLASALDLPMADGTVLRNAEVRSVVDGSVCLTVKEDVTERKTIMIIKLSSFAAEARSAIAGVVGVPEATVAEGDGTTSPIAVDGAAVAGSADGSGAEPATVQSPEARALRKLEQRLASATAARRRYKSAYDRAYRESDADISHEEYVSDSKRERRDLLLKECRKAMDGYTSAVGAIHLRDIFAGTQPTEDSRGRHQEAIDELSSSQNEYAALISLAESRADKATAAIEAKRARDLEERRVAAMEKQADTDRRRANQEANLEWERRAGEQREAEDLRRRLLDSEQELLSATRARPQQMRPQQVVQPTRRLHQCNMAYPCPACLRMRRQGGCGRSF